MCTLGLSSYIWLATHLILKLMLIVLSELQTLGERLLVTYIHFSSIYFCVCSMIDQFHRPTIFSRPFTVSEVFPEISEANI